ncbi:MAG: sulfide/dihydroorotate dehydrogenase-like FAD/NAD-binding protein [Promethearchaeota archaeon]
MIKIEKEEENEFEKPDFYEKLINILVEQEKYDVKNLTKSETCIYFNVWEEPYQIDNERVFENCIEIILGNLKSSNSLMFSEAISLNSYHGNLRFSKGNLAWSRGSASSQELISINPEIYTKIKNVLKVDEWTKDTSYKKNHIINFTRILKNYLLERISSQSTNKRKPVKHLEKGRNTEVDFRKADFYNPLINKLENQDVIKTDELETGETCLYFDTWREPYRVGNDTMFEDCIEVVIGDVGNAKPLTFSEAISLNSYHGGLNYTKGVSTWSSGSKNSSRKIMLVEPELLNRLKIMLKPNFWLKKISYSEKNITTFVRVLENYFMGKYLGKNFRIVQKDLLVEETDKQDAIYSIEVEAPDIATMAKPGQFVVVRLGERGERIPLTIADLNKESGLIRLIYQTIGKTTKELATLGVGDNILDLLGPLGVAIDIKKYNKPVICIGGGVGIASIYSKAKALKEMGNYVISIIGSKKRNALILEEELRKVSDEFYVTTDNGDYMEQEDGTENFYRLKSDGSKVYGGYLNSVLEALLGKDKLLKKAKEFVSYGPNQMVGKYLGKEIAEIIAVGPLIMMRSIVNVITENEKYDPISYEKDMTKTYVSLNTIMLDGTGMCGSCRCRIYNPINKRYETKFACVDGPVFNGLLVDFNTLLRRSRQYMDSEVKSENYLDVMGW